MDLQPDKRSLFSILRHQINPTFIWILIGIATTSIFFSPTNNWTWDPSYYYAQLRSPIIENDLDFRNETLTNGVATRVTATGLQGTVWPIGPAIFWAPFFLAAHLYMKIFNPLKANGFYFPYIALVSMGSALYGIAGLVIIYKTIRQYGDRFISALTICLCTCATAAFFYIFRQPIMAHTTSLFVSSGFILIYIWLSKGLLPIKISGLLFGVLLGLNFIVRWSGLLIAILPVGYFLNKLVLAYRERNYIARNVVYWQIFVFILSFSLTITPQMVLWYRLYGSFVALPQDLNTFISNPLPANVFKIILDSERGVLYNSPFVLISIMSLVFIPDRLIRFNFITYVLATIILIGYRVDWYGGGGYYSRYFIELLPVLALGFVCLFRKVVKGRIGKLMMMLVALILLIHQFFLIYAYEHSLPRTEGFVQFLQNPSIVLAPLPYVAQGRQAVLINFLSGIREIGVYLIPGLAVIVSPIITIVFLFIISKMRKVYLVKIAIGTVIYMLIWSFYLMVVGKF